MSLPKTSASDPIGRGLLFPLRRVGEDFESGTGEVLLKSNVAKVLNTDGATEAGDLLGEYPFRLDFGSSIRRSRHTNIRDVRTDIAIIRAAQAVARWEPRAAVLTDRSFAEKPASSTTRSISAPRSKRLVVVFRKESDVTGPDVSNQQEVFNTEVAL